MLFKLIGTDILSFSITSIPLHRILCYEYT